MCPTSLSASNLTFYLFLSSFSFSLHFLSTYFSHSNLSLWMSCALYTSIFVVVYDRVLNKRNQKKKTQTLFGYIQLKQKHTQEKLNSWHTDKLKEKQKMMTKSGTNRKIAEKKFTEEKSRQFEYNLQVESRKKNTRNWHTNPSKKDIIYSTLLDYLFCIHSPKTLSLLCETSKHVRVFLMMQYKCSW